MKASSYFVALSLAALSAGAQSTPPSAGSLYRSRAIERAFENGTRSLSGHPGQKYWQNQARYVMTVTALPPDRRILDR